MWEIIETLQKAFDSILDLNIKNDVQTITNRGEILNLIMKAQVLISELNNK